MNIQVVQGKYNYFVRVNDSVYEMSRDADMPNGVNMYLGEYGAFPTEFRHNPKVTEIPLGIVKAIVQWAIADAVAPWQEGGADVPEELL